MIEFVKAQACGNDFLLVPGEGTGHLDLVALTRRLCDRRTGVGADGLIVYERLPGGASMRLFNADGSRAEVSGNGVRCLAAILEREDPGRERRSQWSIETEAGEKRLTFEKLESGRYWFRAWMGQPSALRQVVLDAGGERVAAVTLSIGNPHCVVLCPLDEERFGRLGPALERHPAFPGGTNVEFVHVEAPDRIEILIWERGVGPTLSSGTGACASAVVAARHRGAGTDLMVASPGGTQRVELLDEGIYLSGWAEILAEGRWLQNP